MTSAENLFEQAVVAARDGLHDRAFAFLDQTLIVNPKHIDAWGLRARLEYVEGRYFNALLHYNAALASAPHRFDLWGNRGMVCGRLRWLDEAENSLKKSLELQNRPEPHHNLCELYIAQLRLREAEHEAREILKIHPDDPRAKMRLGLILLALGDWKAGWAYYEARYRAGLYPPAARMRHKPWMGQDLRGKRILLYPGGGYGDEILALRFVGNIAARGAEIVLAVRSSMLRLARGLDAQHVICEGDPLPFDVDFACELVDVPLHTGLHSSVMVPGIGGYLKKAAPLEAELPPGLRIGLCWDSGRRSLMPETNAIAEEKSLPLATFGFLKDSGAVLVSLQKDVDRADHKALAKFGLLDLMGDMHDFADTAALIDELDLVISVDTAVAHLAGALGKPVWNLVRHSGLWPWFNDFETTFWYKSMKLYRQRQAYDWSEPLSRLQDDLLNLPTAAGLAA